MQFVPVFAVVFHTYGCSFYKDLQTRNMLRMPVIFRSVYLCSLKDHFVIYHSKNIVTMHIHQLENHDWLYS